MAVVQPNIARTGGLTEIRRIADIADMAGVEVIPHGWKTGITGIYDLAEVPALHVKFEKRELFGKSLIRIGGDL